MITLAKMTIDAAQSGAPSFNVIDEAGICRAKVYHCKDGVVVSTSKGNYRLRSGPRSIENQLDDVQEVPHEDGFDVTGPEPLVKVNRRHLKTLAGMECDNPGACGKGALCNSCWSKTFAERALREES